MLASPGLELENDESVFGWFEASLIGWLDWKMMSWLRELDDLVSTNAPSEAFFVENKALRKTCYYGQQLKWNWLQIHLRQPRSKIVRYQKSPSEVGGCVASIGTTTPGLSHTGPYPNHSSTFSSHLLFVCRWGSRGWMMGGTGGPSDRNELADGRRRFVEILGIGWWENK